MTHRPDCADTCNGDWCACSCHHQADADEMLADALELGEFDEGERPDPRRWAR